MTRLRELLRRWRLVWGVAEVALLVCALFLNGCLSAGEKAVVKSVAEIAKDLCTAEMTWDACIDRILADQRYRVAKFNRLVSEDAGLP